MSTSTNTVDPTAQGLMFHGRAPGDRDDGAEVMRTWRAVSLAAAGARPRLPPVEYAVLLAVQALTASWTRLWDEVYVADVAIVAGLMAADGTGDAKECGRRLRSLAGRGLVSYQPSRIKGRPSRIGLGTGLPPTAVGATVRGGHTAPPKPNPDPDPAGNVRGGHLTPPNPGNRGGQVTPPLPGGVREEIPPPSADAGTGTQTGLLVAVPGGGESTSTTTTDTTPADTTPDALTAADVRLVLDAIAAVLPLPARGRALLAGPVRDALASGWDPVALGVHLAAGVRPADIRTTAEALMRYRLRLGDQTRPRVLPEGPAVCPCAPCRRHTAATETADRQAAARREQARAAERHQAVAAEADLATARHDAIDEELGPVLHGRIVQAAIEAHPILRTRTLSAERVRRLASQVYAEHDHDVARLRDYAQGLPVPAETAPATQTTPNATQSITPTPTYPDTPDLPSAAELAAAIAARVGAA
ncbi:hypothetical protein [Frankia sp. AgB32]|uniref:hypothetical protein n=1 Tax=Frankia sp. AgB32 TaxID=631119 RepID=UPI00200CFBA1|nr:hypothetical protein [Frankia sp. AgB32]MCK9895235.1 hypothetical protein [Frankia sp. AgB32]